MRRESYSAAGQTAISTIKWQLIQPPAAAAISYKQLFYSFGAVVDGRLVVVVPKIAQPN